MNIKSDLREIKNAFDTDAQILQSAFRFEIFLKRYAKQLIVFAVVLLFLLVSWIIYTQLTHARLEKANTAYTALLSLPSEIDAHENAKELLQTLKDNNHLLYEFYLFTYANTKKDVLEELSKSKNEFISTIANYQLAQSELSDLFSTQDSQAQNFDVVFGRLESLKAKDFREWAIMQQAALLIQEGQIQEAKDKIGFLDLDSIFSMLGQFLKHYK
ncbi:MAG: tetratricopeptide repeat protein [Helicobacter sp.]|uniref:tetratricopeptide repeat protein n=1 Tax=Helicobacter sp. 10-6591 TaxID=2004998 RepID=UPI000DCDF17C|nr:tetratricopeptide repeat protein [Helicobacter sp. 10-6591]MCI6218043.1 tetratricopeptide repeat protein [Helicobacter sp.]MDD7567046.1 tetratricopeptide repeat protein [Helicobacter sp.]MDY5740752.1 tetratricopeptide repeat protein [Helicobacter sp.]RAX54528.1 hypothetical protein CCY97_05725 [Helicobacter sp. 10-6591]